MPYIKQDDREKFTNSVKEVLGVLGDPNDNLYVKGEYFGFFATRFVKKFLSDPTYTNPAFNSSYFNLSKSKTLSNAADSMSAMINRTDPIAGAGELNYVLSVIYWGFLGESKDFSKASYGVRAYIDGMFDKICSSIETVNTGSQKDMTMAFRRHIVIRGVLRHVQAEGYRRLDVPYEDSKIAENGDIWVDGEINAWLEFF